MKKSSCFALMQAYGGKVTIQSLGDSMYCINGHSIIDLLHPPIITESRITYIDQMGQKHFKSVSTPNPDHRGDIPLTNTELFLNAFFIAFGVTVTFGLSILRIYK